MFRRKIIKEHIYRIIKVLTGNDKLDTNCINLKKLGINSSNMSLLIEKIENDFEISLQLDNAYTGVTTIEILCNLIEIEIYSKW